MSLRTSALHLLCFETLHLRRDKRLQKKWSPHLSFFFRLEKAKDKADGQRILNVRLTATLQSPLSLLSPLVFEIVWLLLTDATTCR